MSVMRYSIYTAPFTLTTTVLSLPQVGKALSLGRANPCG